MRVRNSRHPGKTCLTSHGSIKLDAEGYAEVSDEAAKSLAACGWELAPAAGPTKSPAVLVPEFKPEPPPAPKKEEPKPEPVPEPVHHKKPEPVSKKEEEKPAHKKEYAKPAPANHKKK